jgi:DNA end-binding protein Ku
MIRRATKKTRQPRASWKGRLTIDLVQFNVEAFNAVASDEGEIHFHQLHAECHSRIRYQKVCPIHGPIDNDEIVLGYEYARNKYVEVDPDELDAMRTDADKALKLDTFIAPEQLDPRWFDGRTYYLLPTDTEDREPYALVQAALLEMNRYGIGEMVFSQREQLAAVRATDDNLVLSMLRYSDAFRDASDFTPPRMKVTGKKVDLARMLIYAATEKEFNLSRYADEYQTKLEKFVDAKIAGEEIETPPEREEAEPVINLMDALKRSIAHTSGHDRGHDGKSHRKNGAQGRRTKRTSRRKKAS